MAKIMDPVLPILSILGYRAIILGSLGGLGNWYVEYRDKHPIKHGCWNPPCLGPWDQHVEILMSRTRISLVWEFHSLGSFVWCSLAEIVVPTVAET